jgi:DNA-binding transcriptional regulator YdaS (Cro superfamily)
MLCIMTLKDFLKTLKTIEERSAFADRCETTYGMLRNVAYGKRAGESLCINIERETNGKVTCEDLRPDVDWAYIRGTKKAA